MKKQGSRALRVMVLGVRGIPGVQGGVETHVENLYSRLADLGCDIEVLVRSRFVPASRKQVGAIRITRIWCPKRPGLEAFVHSMLGVLYAVVSRPDLLHIHAIGPAIVTPIARIFGLRVVVTHHGPDYDRDKWGNAARWVLRVGERWGVRYSHARIVISKVIADILRINYGVVSDLIPNGVNAAALQADSSQLRQFDLEPGKYILQVGRIVPEKRQLELIRAFARASLPGWKLALVGGLDDQPYSRQVQSAAKAAGVVLTGFQSGVTLQQLYSHAGLFVLPSSHEGLPIALLEALSFGLPVLASDIPANLELGLDASCYFHIDDLEDLATKLSAMTAARQHNESRSSRMHWVGEKYDWVRIAGQTMAVYRRILPG